MTAGDQDRTGARQPEDKPSKPEDLPAAGPHAEDHLTDQRKTPGTGALPDPGKTDEIDPGAG